MHKLRPNTHDPKYQPIPGWYGINQSDAAILSKAGVTSIEQILKLTLEQRKTLALDRQVGAKVLRAQYKRRKWVEAQLKLEQDKRKELEREKLAIKAAEEKRRKEEAEDKELQKSLRNRLARKLLFIMAQRLETGSGYPTEIVDIAFRLAEAFMQRGEQA